jgi:hypothetical protein
LGFQPLYNCYAYIRNKQPDKYAYTRSKQADRYAYTRSKQADRYAYIRSCGLSLVLVIITSLSDKHEFLAG